MKAPTGRLAIGLLLAIPPLLMELMVGNQPGFVFFQPVILLILFVGYSLPVLAIRELAVRFNAGYAGIIVLGLAYGIINEGLGAKTLLMHSGLPNPAFDGYGFFLGINFAWLPYILIMHAIMSVTLPILFVHYFFPHLAGQRLIGNKALATLGIISYAALGGIFLGPYPITADPIYLAVFTAAIILLFAVATFLPRQRPEGNMALGIGPLLSGALFVIMMVAIDIFVSAKPPLAIYFLIFMMVQLSFLALIMRKRWFNVSALLSFGLGSAMMLGITGTVNSVMIKGHPEGLMIGIVFEAVILYLALLVIRKSKHYQQIVEK